MTNIKTHCYYTVEIPFNAICSSAWAEYHGEHVGRDWWMTIPKRFGSEEDAVKAVRKSDNYKNCSYRIVKTIVTSAITHEFEIS